MENECVCQHMKWMLENTCGCKTADGSDSPELTGYAHKDMEHWAEEYECAILHLDDLQVPKHDETGKVFSLVGRIDKAISLASA